MRARVLALLAAGAATSAVGVVACVDLFHSTGDVLTACQLDAQTPGCTPEAGVEAGSDAATDFCAWSEPQALQHAQHACAWLGACETPLGRNAFGSCMFAALLAYDCAANPNHPVKGTTHALWDCLWQANSCGTVNACVFPQGSQVCGGGPFVTCASQGGSNADAGINGDVRVECTADGAAPNGENCALWGQACGGNLSEGVCGGSPGSGALTCTTEYCDNTMLHVCNDAGIDIGIDCTNNGAQRCGGFPTAAPASWVACLPESDAGGCTPSDSAECDGGIATSCPAGLRESIDCQRLLNNAHACTPGPLSPPYDWTSPCIVSDDEGDAGDGGGAADAGGDASGAPTCVADTCNGTTLTACYRGASFPLDCAQVGLGACGIVKTDQGTLSNAACARPAP